ncbi:hypothetical protein Hbl1158_03085 [Halobaculum sp. CBA1158]|uniref:hypothetical protein n=1 Tax=Halobaculum sp. CBA1158 TaxID=2904243 RepID=UPI001F284935|nr:hypothetical protein [Halobaculum sp. CBA1158]UIP00370.1 hypothetical protein Hbl1158_03085 [Halobaculum sp. CBA1158]
MSVECAIWRACTGEEAVARVSDASPPRSFRNRPVCSACLAVLESDPTVDAVVNERFTARPA